MLVQMNFANLPFILRTLVNMVLLYFLIYLHHNFTPSIKLISSTNHFQWSVSRIDVTFLILLTWYSFSIYLRCIILNHFIHLLHGLLKYTVSGNKPPPIYLYGWLLQALLISSLSYETNINYY